jgi:4-hydroxybenzoate polyprenyltransferase
VLKKLFDFFIFSSLFIALCAVLMVYQVSILFDIKFDFVLAGFVFSGSVCSYNFHWYLTPPDIEKPTEKLIWNISNKKLHFVLFIIGLIGSGIFSLLLINHWIWLVLTALLTFLYSAPKIPFGIFSSLKNIAIGKTLFLAFAWAHVTTLLPFLIDLEKIEAVHVWFVLNRFFFIYAICILFDYRDVEEDRKAGIRSLITYLDEKSINLLFWFTMFLFVVSCFLLSKHFSIDVLIALLIPGIILSLLYYPAKRNFSDYFYYFILDGLMMLSVPLLLLTKFAR